MLYMGIFNRVNEGLIQLIMLKFHQIENYVTIND